MNGLPYYRAYPRDFIDGTAGMPFELKGAYRILLDLIYLQNGLCPDDAQYIAGLLGMSVRKWKSIRSSLIELGKIAASGGFISNSRADLELENTRSYRDQQAEKARKPRKNKGIQKPQLSHTDTDTSEAKASGADGAQSIGEILWTRGVSYLIRSGVKEKSARSMIGKWRKDHGDDAVMDAFRSAGSSGVSDPVAFITRALKPKQTAVEQKTDQWGIPDAQPVRVEPRPADLDAVATSGAADLSRVQSPEAEEDGALPFGDDDTGWAGGVLPSLRLVGGCRV